MKSSRMTVGQKIAVGFSIALLMPIVVGVLAYRSSERLAESSAWVTHTYEVLSDAEALVSALKDIQTSERGYGLTGGEDFLEPRTLALPKVGEISRKLRRLTTDNPKQQARLDRLDPLIDQRIERSALVVETRREKGLEGVVALITTRDGKKQMDTVRKILDEFEADERSLLDRRMQEARDTVRDTFFAIAAGTGFAVLLVSFGAYFITRSITVPVREVVNQLTASSSELLAGTTQQATGAQEQAVAVTQTVTTVDEVTQTADHAAKGARGLGETIHRSLEIGRTGRKAVLESVAATDSLRTQIDTTAESILALAGHTQSIGEIIASVNDIAEQTNVLALNAAIEASRAGEHGRGFGVVAGEVKALADLAKKATSQVRMILGDVQRSTNSAVIAIEEVTKGIVNAARVNEQSGQTIQALGDTLQQAAQVSGQIVASAGQQATGMTQIHQAMRSLDQVAKQNMAATRQAEQAARNLTSLGRQLTDLVGS